MTCRRNLSLARTHCETVTALETCAPPVTAPYLAAAIERCKLPIRVKCWGDGDLIMISDDEWRMTFTTPHADIASSRYLSLCESLTAPDLSSSQGATAGEQSPAFLSRSAAAPPSAHSPADDALPPKDNGASAASPVIPGEAAPFSVPA